LPSEPSAANPGCFLEPANTAIQIEKYKIDIIYLVFQYP
jgi:hypothetical protein